MGRTADDRLAERRRAKSNEGFENIPCGKCENYRVKERPDSVFECQICGATEHDIDT